MQGTVMHAEGVQKGSDDQQQACHGKGVERPLALLPAAARITGGHYRRHATKNPVPPPKRGLTRHFGRQACKRKREQGLVEKDGDENSKREKRRAQRVNRTYDRLPAGQQHGRSTINDERVRVNQSRNKCMNA